MSLSPLRRNLRLCTYDGIAATPIVFLLQPSNFIMAALLVEVFKLPPAIYGLIASLPFWGNFGQAFLMPLVSRIYSPKSVAVAMCLLQAICWGVIAVMIGFLPRDQPELSGRWFVALFAISAAVGSLLGVSWISWVQEWVPERLRGKYFGVRNRILQVVQILFLLLTGWMLSLSKNSILAFQIVLGGAAILRVISLVMQRRIKADSPLHLRTQTKHTLSEQVSTLLAVKPYLWLVAYGTAWGLASSTFGPFYAVFMYRELGLSTKDVGLIVTIASLGGALAAPAWGALADRFGNKPVMLFCMIAWQLQNFLWCLLTPDRSWLLYGMWAFGGVVSTGFILSLFNLQLKVIPAQAKTLAISANLAITALASAVGPIVGGKILQHLLGQGAHDLSVYHHVFLVQPVAALLACFLLTRVNERAASPLSSVVGAMRNVRTLSSVVGLNILVDYMFVKPQPAAKRSDRDR